MENKTKEQGNFIRTLWNRKEQQEAQDEYGKKCTKHNAFFDNNDSNEFAGPDMRNSHLSNREQILITKCVSYSDDLANTLISTTNENHNNSDLNQTSEDSVPTYHVKVTRPHTVLAAKVLEDTEVDVSNDENETRLMDVYMDEDGNSIDNDDVCDDDEDEIE